MNGAERFLMALRGSLVFWAYMSSKDGLWGVHRCS